LTEISAVLLGDVDETETLEGALIWSPLVKAQL